MKYITTVGEKEFVVEVIDEHRLVIQNQIVHIDFHPVSDQPVYSLLINGKSYEAYVFPTENSWQVLLHGKQYAAKVEDERERRLRAASSEKSASGKEFHLKAPMPGLVVTIVVEEGQKVQKGELLVILESMKMQNELKSPRDGTVSRIRIASGESVELHQTMLSVI
jgi:biotin carboxyl carrier protein